MENVHHWSLSIYLKVLRKLKKHTFYGCSKLQCIDIPHSLTSINLRAFEGCSSLASIHLPEGLTGIGELAFSGCHALSHISIPDSVKMINENAFVDCSALMSINIPKSIVHIGETAFSRCTKLSTIIIPDNVNSKFHKIYKENTFIQDIFNGTPLKWIVWNEPKSCTHSTDTLNCISRSDYLNDFHQDILKLGSIHPKSISHIELNAIVQLHQNKNFPISWDRKLYTLFESKSVGQIHVLFEYFGRKSCLLNKDLYLNQANAPFLLNGLSMFLNQKRLLRFENEC